MDLGKSRSEVSTMKLINVTNSHSRLVMSQLESTDAELVKVYTAGDTLVIYTLAPTHVEILLYNNKRKIRHSEIEEIRNYFIQKLPENSFDENEIKVLDSEGLIEISIPKKAS